MYSGPRYITPSASFMMDRQRERTNDRFIYHEYSVRNQSMLALLVLVWVHVSCEKSPFKPVILVTRHS